MFDTYQVLPQVAVTNTTTVHQHRAPTDQSVRLLREMEDKAKSEVEKAVLVENTVIDAVIHKIPNYVRCCTDYVVLFKINGKQYRAEYTEMHLDERKKDRRALALGLRDSIAETVANVITDSVMRSMYKF